MPSSRSLRIGNVSGATGDAAHAMHRMARCGNVDVITGDWLSEMNIAWNAIAKLQDPDTGYEVGFLQQLEESLDEIVQQGMKVVTNAGALNTTALSRKVEELCRRKQHHRLVVASVYGGDVTSKVKSSQAQDNLRHLDHTDVSFSDWSSGLTPSCAVAYIGGWGITEALRKGADIVICGRVTDASPVIGAAAWWYDWDRTAYDQLAGALVAGHLIECGPYATGANFSGFKEFLPSLVDLAFPIAEILPSGECFITKSAGWSGTVNKFNITAQLLYELQGELYLNPDVVADLSKVSIDSTSQIDRIFVSGITGHPPPPTLKCMVAAEAGYQAETTYYINGLDVAAKAQMMKAQLSNAFRDCKFTKFSVELYGSEIANPRTQAAGTVMLRVFAQARRKEDISAANFKAPIYSLRMQSYPGYHMNLDFRTMEPKPFMEIFPSLIDASEICHRVAIGSESTDVAPPPETKVYPNIRPSYETAHPVPLDVFGPTKRAPLGYIVHARSGDKANNSNVGFFVRHPDEYTWLQTFLTVDRIKSLLEDDWDTHGNGPTVERCEFPNLCAVHFRILDFLDGGIASSSRIDGLGKGIGESLRSKEADLPAMFLDRGRI
ncbi:hypothetical protein LTR56_026258 [Elasticomyces elasticus]|nr:hypothetical protein LTR56_026258 [Elasticomyces elasticus]KAK3619045.1 hypothetical protein LTR22_026122 [Elasticomyces elasticus]KAK5729583.1 hypothetical protein LTS12_027329 [Elasticomyces elasticus]